MKSKTINMKKKLLFTFLSLTLILGSTSQILVSAEGVNKGPGSTAVLSENHSIRYGGEDNSEFSFYYSVTEVNGQLWATDFINHRISVYTSTGQWVKDINSLNGGGFSQPSDIINNGTHIFFINTSTRNVTILDFDGNFVNDFDITNSSGYVIDMEFNGTHYFFVDKLLEIIWIYDMSFNSVQNITISGLGYNMGISDELIFVTSNSGGNIRIFDKSFNLVGTFGSSELTSVRDILVHDDLIYVANTTSIVIYDRNYEIVNIVDNYDNLFFSKVDQLKVIFDRLYVTTELFNIGIFVYDLNVQGVTASSGVDSIRISWSSPSMLNLDQVDYYHIYRGVSIGSLNKIATVSADSSSFIDTVVRINQTYYYAVSIVNQYGETSLSEVVSEKVDLGAIAGEDNQNDGVIEEDTSEAGFLSLQLLWGMSVILAAVVLLKKFKFN